MFRWHHRLAVEVVETKQQPAENVNKMDQLFGKVNGIAIGALGAAELLLIIWLVRKLMKNKKQKKA